MDCLICEQVYCVMEGETVLAAVDFYGLLSDGETLTGTPVVKELDANGDDASSGDLTIENISLNTTEMEILGRTASANEVVLFQVKGFKQSNSPYYLRVECDMTDGQHRSVWVKLRVPEPPTKS